ncbi:hypothetical protein B0H21DRAFT_578606 [Amylocystis lapponica]|nr:hypothetical protein B0H21DRAFT_578606 [Amylocystis lapponica]
MPAQRNRGHGSKRAPEGGQLTWTTPISSSSAGKASFAFAPNITPGTFTDPLSSPVDCATESLLFPSTVESTSGRRQGHTKKKPEDHIPRPPNAFILFRSSFIKNQHVSTEVETNHSTLSKIIGLTWQSLPAEERQIWHAKAKVALDEHKRKFPEYAFRPLHTKAKGESEKRKVREVGPKDMKRCAKIAELLVEGKKGSELDAAIQEFDRHHVPEIVTRFETPITARTYRRSSSAPVQDTEHSSPTFLPASASARSAKLRATSSQPDITLAAPYPEPSSSTSSLSRSGSEYQGELYNSPSSSFVETSPAYQLPMPNPTFDFTTFSFNACNALPIDSCDPLAAGCEDTLQYFSHPSSAYSSQNDAYGPSSLSVDTTTFFDDWTSASSPLSSMPGTPHSFIDMPDPMAGMDAHGYQHFADGYGAPSCDLFQATSPMSRPTACRPHRPPVRRAGVRVQK